MINGNPEEFIESVCNCQDIAFIYKGEKYWYQGYTFDDGVWEVHMECYRMSDGKNIWHYDGSRLTIAQASHGNTEPDRKYIERHIERSIREGQKSFETSPIFDGKTFWEVEKEIEWVDC